MTAIARLAEFVLKTTLDDCPREALTQVRRAMLDTIGVTLAGAREPAARAVREVARAEGGAPLCTVIGTALRASPSWAALANGTAGHAHDFDDTSFTLMGHPSVPLLAAALACGEAEMVDGAAVALAYVVGFEVDAVLGAAVNPEHYQRGWHATSTIGTLGCAAAAARLLGLDAGRTRHALGLAASLASGLKENFGSMTKPFHAGHAAKNGVLAALLAREGLTASERALDGGQGYLAAFSGGDAERLAWQLDGLGRRWHLVETGIAVKPYPACAQTHSAVEALIELRARHRLQPADVAEVEIGVHPLTPDILTYSAPTTGLERKFSMQFCAAAALAEGRLDLASFADDGVSNPDVQTLMARVRMTVDPERGQDVERRAWTRIRLRLADGRVLESPARGAAGHPDRPLSPEALRTKFLAGASTVLAPDEAEAVAEQIDHLEEIPDIRALTSRLVGPME
ncbi:MAG: MmgE/PrpD family protein [Candidatus Rokubacteria bacterium]|nr:MmgE/PrpD family protein [Candidatus Rokubacteria bacterium]